MLSGGLNRMINDLLAEVSTHNHRPLEECQQNQNELEQRIQPAESNDQEGQSISNDRTAKADGPIQLEAEIIQHIQVKLTMDLSEINPQL